MKRLLLVAAVASGSGCVTGAAIARPNRVTIPMLVGAALCDFAVTALLASQAQDFSTGASVATGVAVTAADVGVGCILGACKPLRP